MVFVSSRIDVISPINTRPLFCVIERLGFEITEAAGVARTIVSYWYSTNKTAKMRRTIAIFSIRTFVDVTEAQGLGTTMSCTVPRL